jgi:hypothetical protein
MSGEMKNIVNIMAYLLKARIGEPEKPPLLGNGCITSNNTKAIIKQHNARTNGVTVGRGVLYVVCASSDEGMPYHQTHNCLTIT